MPTDQLALAEPNRMICHEPWQMRESIEWLAACDLAAVDIETIPHEKGKSHGWVMTVVSYSGICDQKIRSYAYQFTSSKSAKAEPPSWLANSVEAVRRINATPVPKVLHNGVYDSAWFLRYGLPLSNYAWDSMTLWWSRYPDMPKSLATVASILLDDYSYWKAGRKDNDFTGHTLYAMQDTEATLRCAIRLMRWAYADPSMLRNYLHAHARCLIGLGMSMKGLKVDFEKRAALESALEKDAETKLAEFRYLVAKPDMNPQSPQQMKELFYRVLGASPRNAKGRPVKIDSASTGRIALRAVRNEHPVFARIIGALDAAKEPAKQLSNVIGLEFPDGRFRTSYDGVGTTTTRFSSRRDAFGFGGNGQNIRKKYRCMMRADDESFLLEIDLSAADDVFVGYESEDPRKIEVIESGVDSHSYNAANVFFTNWTYEQVVAGKKADDPAVVDPITGIRQITKKTTHGANYLMAGMTLLMSAGREAIVAAARHLGHDNAGSWSTERLAEFCDSLDLAYRKYYTRFARQGVDSFYTDLHHELLRTSSFTTLFMYRQRFTGDLMDQNTLRACAASVGQANTAGRINMAMMELELGVRQIRFRDGEAPDLDDPVLQVSEREHGCSLRLQTHDSIGYNVNYTHPNWQEGVRRILHVMQRPVVCKGRVIRVGIEADVAVRWAEDTVQIKDVAGIEKWLSVSGR